MFFSEKRGLRQFFSEKQIEQIIMGCPDWLRPMVVTSYLTGMRQGEILSLRWENVDLEEGIIYLPKSKTLKDESGKGQRVIMQRELITLFESISRKSEYVFCRSDGSPYIRDHIYEPFKKVLRSLGIDDNQFSWKDLRHTTGSILRKKGVPILDIKEQLRHSDIRTTVNFYVGSDTEYQRKQIEKLTFSKPGKKIQDAAQKRISLFEDATIMLQSGSDGNIN